MNGFYSRRIFPYLLDRVMSDQSFAQYRQAVLSDVRGSVLEIGFGTGLNLSYYPEHIHQLVAIDPNPGARALAQKRVQASSIAVDYRVLNGEQLLISDQVFDTVVSTWTLCSIIDVKQALREIHRVLKPGGKFVFVEHGLSSEPSIQTWQTRLTPIQKVIGDGCHLDRDIRRLVEDQFGEVSIKEFYADRLLKIAGYFYQGIATKVNETT